MAMDSESNGYRARARELVERAHRLLSAAFHAGGGTREGNVPSIPAAQAKALYRANDGQSMQVCGALYSALFELVPEGDLARNTGMGDDALAMELVRVTCNRARRQQRRADRLGAEAARGEVAAHGQTARPLEALARENEDFREIHAQMVELLGSLYEGLDARELQVVQMAAESLTPAEIARALGCHRTTVCRVLYGVYDRFRRISARESRLDEST